MNKKEEKWRTEGALYALRLAKEKGIDYLQEDIKRRGALGMSLLIPEKAAEVKECKKSFRRIIDEQPTIPNDNGDWIPCNKRLPEVPEGLEDMYCPEFNVTIKGAKEATTLKYSCDGTWFDDNGNIYDVVAWQPLPEAYKEQVQRKGEGK